MQTKDFQFTILITLKAESIEAAYKLLCEQMNNPAGPDHSWESTDECYEAGEQVDADVLQEAISKAYDSMPKD